MALTATHARGARERSQPGGWKSRKCLEVGYDDDDWIAKSWMARRRASLGRQSSCSRRSADPYLEAAPDPDPGVDLAVLV